MSADIKPWPVRDTELHERFVEWFCLMDRDLVLDYHRARADKWEQVARMAVEALKSIRGTYRPSPRHPLNDSESILADEAHDAIVLIGPLPPADGEG